LALALKTDDNPQRFSKIVSNLREINNDDLSKVDREILDRLSSPVSMIPDLAGHLIHAGGKRLRPLLTLSAARALDYDGDKHIPLAAAVELIHGATLLHDDVVDDSSLRRGAKTANIIWGNKESVLVGDFIFSRAFELMVQAEDLRVLQILSHASSVIAEGEVLQLATQKNIETTQEMYIEVINAKTAALFSAATHVGAVITKASETIENTLLAFGQNFGIAYQLIDDALDYAGRENSLGKTVGDDFREGKMTLPVIWAIAKGSSEEKSFWQRTITDGVQHDGDFEEAYHHIQHHNGVDETFQLAHTYANAALECLQNLPDNDYTMILADLVISSLTRIH